MGVIGGVGQSRAGERALRAGVYTRRRGGRSRGEHGAGDVVRNWRSFRHIQPTPCRQKLGSGTMGENL